MPLCLFGAGGHGRVVASQVKKLYEGNLCFGDDAIPSGAYVDGIINKYNSVLDITDHNLIFTIGNNLIRRKLQVMAESAGHQIAHIIIDHNNYFAHSPGAGTQVLAGSIVNIGAKIGSGVIINSGAIVEHDSNVGDYCHLAPGSIIGGNVTLGKNVLLGTNATVLPGISIASNCIIGAGAVVTRNIINAGTYTGIPVRS